MHWISRSIRNRFVKEGRLATLSLTARPFSTSAMKSDKFELPSRVLIVLFQTFVSMVVIPLLNLSTFQHLSLFLIIFFYHIFSKY
jgi:hypothetical protein